MKRVVAWILVLAIIASLPTSYAVQDKDLIVNIDGLVIAYAKRLIAAQLPQQDATLFAERLDGLKGKKEWHDSLRKKLAGSGTAEENVVVLLFQMQRDLSKSHMEDAVRSFRAPEMKPQGLPWPICVIFNNC